MRRVAWIGVLVLGFSLGAAARPTDAGAVGTDQELPCGMVCDRTVQPTDVMVNEKVHVHVECHAQCDQTRKPIDVFFVVDRTNTMFEKRYIDGTKDGLIEFVNKMDFETSAAGLITYAQSEQVVTNLTRDRSRLLTGINAIRRSEETDVRGLQGAFRTATTKLDNDGTPGNLRIVIIIAAGQDETEANISMPTVTQAARNAGVNVAFLMFPESRYAHYVQAASDCSSAACPRWSLPGGAVVQKMAWGVTGTDVHQVLASTVFDLLTAPADAISQVRIREFMHSCAAFDHGSSVPPPNLPLVPPYVAMDWIYPGDNPLSIVIDYDAEMVCGDDEYPVTSQTIAVVDTPAGQITQNLPNPLVKVHNPVTVTPTQPATVTPTGAAPTTTPTELAPTVTPTATEQEATYPAYLPGLLRSAEF